MFKSPELQAALDAAEAAAQIMRSFYRRNLEIQVKSDQSPVTQADIQCELAIRQILETQFPKYGFYGEETAARAQDAEFLWLVDPIDGTKAFVREYPMFSTQIALMRRGELVLGVSSAPLYGELAHAEVGSGAFLNGKPLHISAVERLEDAAVSAGNLKTLASDAQAWRRYGGVVARVNRIRGYGDFLHYHLLAAGKIDAVIESDVSILDVAACAVIVREAGGVFTDRLGAQLTLQSTSVLAGNAVLHARLFDALQGATHV